jgi:hypothetical protein
MDARGVTGCRRSPKDFSTIVTADTFKRVSCELFNRLTVPADHGMPHCWMRYPRSSLAWRRGGKSEMRADLRSAAYGPVKVRERRFLRWPVVTSETWRGTDTRATRRARPCSARWRQNHTDGLLGPTQDPRVTTGLCCESALSRWAGACNGKESGKEEDGGGMRCRRKMHVTMHGDELTRRAAVEMGSGVVGPEGRWKSSACVHNTLKHT